MVRKRRTSSINEAGFRTSIAETGMCLRESVLPATLVATLKEEIEQAIEKEVQYHGTKEYQDYGMVLVCAKYGRELLKVFQNEEVMGPFDSILGDKCIAYSNTSTSMPPHTSNYSERIHVDSPVEYPNSYLLRLSALILLDDFTEENGATWYLPNSQNMVQRPSEKQFVRGSKRLIAPAGSIFYWNPRIWHRGGKNSSSDWRHAFTIVMCRNFMKQRLDLPSLLEDVAGIEKLSVSAKRRLGFYSVPPSSYDEYYSAE